MWKDALAEEESLENAKRRREQAIHDIRNYLSNKKFAAADKLFTSSKALSIDDYIRLKNGALKEYIREKFAMQLSDEQVNAVALPYSPLLVQARAGSGKTTVLVCKAALALEQEQLHPDQVMILAFNTDAAQTANDRMRKVFRVDGYANARTFHSLAYRIVQPTEKIIGDDSFASIGSQTRFVQDSIEEVRDRAFERAIYEIWRDPISFSVKPTSKHARYIHYELLRATPQLTLRGELVKSLGEKYIADFLFEHGIKYEYERSYRWKRTYRPDFTIWRSDGSSTIVILEHWGIDPENPPAAAPASFGTIDPESYLPQVYEKRGYWRTRGIPLLETSVADLRGDRTQFEGLLKSKLEAVGIRCVKLPDEELQAQMWTRQRDRISQSFLQFINRTKKLGLSHEQLRQRIETRPASLRLRKFWSLGLLVFPAYQALMERKRQIDFEALLARAIERVNSTAGECSFGGGYGERHHVKLNELRWLLLDEFQDFSPKLYQLINAIVQHNPKLQVFCVGDDWQAIYGFAGAHTTYLRNFPDWFKNGECTSLRTNRRSAKEIVKLGNRLMADYPPLAEPLRRASDGTIKVNKLDDVPFEPGNNDSLDKRYQFDELAFDDDYQAAKTVKVVYSIASHERAAGKQIVVLSRTDSLHGVRLGDYHRKLQKLLRGKNEVRFSTIHKYKGLEADFVVLANACDDVMPMVHPDNSLQSLFYDSEEDAWEQLLEEELRLFYVAASRAKERFSILTRAGSESEFLLQAGVLV